MKFEANVFCVSETRMGQDRSCYAVELRSTNDPSIAMRIIQSDPQEATADLVTFLRRCKKSWVTNEPMVVTLEAEE